MTGEHPLIHLFPERIPKQHSVSGILAHLSTKLESVRLLILTGSIG